jgi:uncharacterized protein (DUF433 family)
MKKPTTIRLLETTRLALEAMAQRDRRDVSGIINEMLEENLRMRRIPGVVFADGATGRRARVAGTGLEVFEIAAAFRAVAEEFPALRECYPWLSEAQLRAALAYAEAYPDEIYERLEREEAWTAESLRARYPFMAPPCTST